MAALHEAFYTFRFSENSHFFLMTISSVPFLPLPVVTQQTAEGFWDFPLEQGCCQVLQCIIGGNDTQTGFR